MSDLVVLNKNTPAIIRLCNKDKRLAKVIDMVGEITYKPHKNEYERMVNSIIGQMLTNKVAQVMRTRLFDLCSVSVTPENISNISDS